MGRRLKKKQQKLLKMGDFVFAKVRGFRAWPARILHHEGSMYHVFFYGTCNIAKVGVTQLFDFEKYKARLGDVQRGANGWFKSAMLHVENSQDHPNLDHGYLRAKAALKATVDQQKKQRQMSSDSESDSNNSSMAKKRSKFNEPFVHITGDTD
ncbi:hypothetical protein KR044_002359 [Drosophila immigrans]|nr:hypothetical protein KR044_002359 [Drosophila immigrans]